MENQTVKVQLRMGLHARPAALFVLEANKFVSDLYVEKSGMTVNAKSIMGIMSLAINYGADISIQAKGPDAKEAIAALVAFVQREDLET